MDRNKVLFVNVDIVHLVQVDDEHTGQALHDVEDAIIVRRRFYIKAMKILNASLCFLQTNEMVCEDVHGRGLTL